MLEKRIEKYIDECKESIKQNGQSEDAEIAARHEMLIAVVSDLTFILKDVKETRKRKYFYDSFSDGKLYEYFPETNSISRKETERTEYTLVLAPGSNSFNRIWVETDEKRK